MSGSVRTKESRASYLSPAASLPLGAPSASASPLLAGFGGRVMAVFILDGAAGPGHAAHLTGFHTSSTGGRALQQVEEESNGNQKLFFVFNPIINTKLMEISGSTK